MLPPTTAKWRSGARRDPVVPSDEHLAIMQQLPHARRSFLDRVASLGCEDLQDEAAQVRVRQGGRLVRAEGLGQKSVGMLIPALRSFDKAQREPREPASIVHVAIVSWGAAYGAPDGHPNDGDSQTAPSPLPAGGQASADSLSPESTGTEATQSPGLSAASHARKEARVHRTSLAWQGG